VGAHRLQHAGDIYGPQGSTLENIEAAIVDGASKWQIATRVKLPQIRPVVMGMGFLGSSGRCSFY